MMTTPQIVSSYVDGQHTRDLGLSVKRLEKVAAHKDLSTIIVIPAFGVIPTKVVASWLNLISPPNQPIVRLFAMGMEVGDAYSQTIQMILDTPALAKFRYLLCLEHDNSPPPDGLVRLLATAEAHPELSAVGGLYFCKGPGAFGCSAAQIWGDPAEGGANFKPLLPDPNGGLVPCVGTGMGFTLFRLSMFKDKKLRRPWFKTTSSTAEGTSTQDLYFWRDAFQHGHRAAVDCSVKVGHFDYEGRFGPPETMW